MRILAFAISAVIALGAYAQVGEGTGSEAQQDSTITALQQEIAKLKLERDIFRGYYLDMLQASKSADLASLDKPFSQLDTVALEALEAKYSPCAEEMADVLAAISKKKADLVLYVQACELINCPYSPEKMTQALELLGQISPSPAAAKEIDEQKALASTVYAEGVKYFCEDIQTLRAFVDREAYTTDKYYAKTINAELPEVLINKPLRKAAYERRISRAPWLKARYDEWLALIQTDAASPRAIEIEEEILPLLPTP